MYSLDSNLFTILSNFLTLNRELVPFLTDVQFRYVQYLPILLLGFTLAFLLTPLLGYLAQKFDILDKPAELRDTKWNKDDNPDRHQHKKPMPLLGGFAVIIPLILISLFTLHFQNDLVFIVIGVLVLSISGLIDEKYNMPAIWQLTFQLIAAIIVIFSTYDLGIIKIPFDGIIDFSWLTYTGDIAGLPYSLSFPGDLIAVGWIILCINAVKWLNGSDALLEGNLLIVFTLIFVIGVRNANALMVILPLIIIGALAGLTIFIFPPAKIYIGSAGKTVLGFLAGTFAFMSGSKFSVTLLVLLLPLLDAFFVIVSRYLREKPKNPLTLLKMNGRDHIHHKLQDLGLNNVQILLTEGSITLLLGSLAILTSQAYRYFLLSFGAFLVLTGIVVINIAAKRAKSRSNKEKEETPESKYSY